MRRLRLAVLVLLACGAFGAGCGGGDEGAEKPVEAFQGSRSAFFGVNGDVMFVRLLDGQEPAIEAPLDRLASTPLGFVRSSVDWRRLQPTAPGSGGGFDFAEHDAWVEQLASRGLRWAPTLLGFPVPAWAADPALVGQCGSKAPPADPASYAAMAAAIAARYGRGGSFWKQHPGLPYEPVTDYEIWNEPNHSSFWCPRPDPERFAELAVAASASVRKVDPKARIVSGGLANFGVTEPAAAPAKYTARDFLAAAVAAEPRLPAAIDAVGFHPYAATGAEVLRAVADFRTALDAGRFAGKEIVVNEAGWPSAGPPGTFTVISDEDVRASAISEVTNGIDEVREEFRIAAFAPYAWTSREADPSNPEDWFGLVAPDSGEPYGAGSAYIDSVESITSR